MLRRLGAVQLDTISVLARSHELVAYARLGAVGPRPGRAGLLGAEELHLRVLVPRGLRATARGLAGLRRVTRRARRAKGKRWHVLEEQDKSCADVRGPPAGRGPAHRERARGRQEGWAVVGLVRDQDRSRVAARHRRARLPRTAGLRTASTTWPSAPSRPICGRRSGPTSSARTRLVAAAGRSLGVATEADLAVYHGLPRPLVRRVLPSTALVPVAVEGWKQPAYRRPRRARVARHAGAGPDGLLSPFDSLHLVPGPGRAPLRPAPSARGLHAEGRSGSSATSPCPCWRAPGSSGWSTRAAGTTRSSPSR